MQATLWQHPNGTWYARWREAGGSRRVSTGEKDEGAARRFLAQFNADLEQPDPASTVGEVLDLYIKDRRAHGTVGMETIVNNAAALRRTMADIGPDQVRNATVRKHRDDRRAEGVSDGTIMRELTTLRAALRRAEAEEWIDRAGVFQMPVQKPASRDRWLTRDQGDRLLAECKTPHLRLFVVLALATGARREAITQLTWDRVDLAGQSIDYGKGSGNKRRARVYIPDDVVDLLKLHRAHATCDHVIEYNGKPLRSVRTALDKAAARAGIPKLGTHVFRHTAATWAIARGETPERVARMLGTSVKIVETVYGHHAPDYLRTTVTAGLVTAVTGDRS